MNEDSTHTSMVFCCTLTGEGSAVTPAVLYQLIDVALRMMASRLLRAIQDAVLFVVTDCVFRKHWFALCCFLAACHEERSLR